jgi:tRNA dimethylallyltransferase
MKKAKIIIVLGQTAAGKSELAVRLAKKFNGEVISADSRQVYKGLDVGTHKITRKEMMGVAHHLLDVADPKKNFSVAQYKKLAERKIDEVLKRKKVPIVCGGTGFYIEAIVDNVIYPEHKPDKKLRKLLENKNVVDLFKILQKLDPIKARNIDRHNPRRLIRAIEISKQAGKVPKIKKTGRRGWDILEIGLFPHQEILKAKIKYRFVRDLEKIISEVKKLHQKGLSWKRMKELGLYYALTSLYLQKKASREEMIRKTSNALWQYAKRQRTWFKRDKRIQWFDPNKKNDLKKINSVVNKFLK